MEYAQWVMKLRIGDCNWGGPTPTTYDLYKTEFLYCAFCCYFNIKYQRKVTSYRVKLLLGFSFTLHTHILCVIGATPIVTLALLDECFLSCMHKQTDM